MLAFYEPADATPALQAPGSHARRPLQRVVQPFATSTVTKRTESKKRSNPFAMTTKSVTTKRPRAAPGSTPQQFDTAEWYGAAETPATEPHEVLDISPEGDDVAGGDVAGVVVKGNASVSRVAGVGAPGFPLGKKRAHRSFGSARGSLGLGRSSAKKPAAAKGPASAKAEVGEVAGGFAKARFVSFFER